MKDYYIKKLYNEVTHEFMWYGVMKGPQVINCYRTYQKAKIALKNLIETHDDPLVREIIERLQRALFVMEMERPRGFGIVGR